jgi:hypothetical protein
VVIGHSFGAKACLRLARRLTRHGITVDGMLTIDSRARSYSDFDSPPNVSDHVNIYRKGPVMPGYAIRGARNRRLHGTTHGGIPGRAEVHAAYRRYLSP